MSWFRWITFSFGFVLYSVLEHTYVIFWISAIVSFLYYYTVWSQPVICQIALAKSVISSKPPLSSSISYVSKILKAMSFNPKRTLTKTLRSLLSDTPHTIEPMGTLVTRASTSQRERGIAAGRNMSTRPIVMVRMLPVIERWIEVIVTPPVK